MNPPSPTWLDERGEPRPKQPCHVCGREVPIVVLPARSTPILRVGAVQGVERGGVVRTSSRGLPVPTDDGRWRLLLVLGEAT